VDLATVEKETVPWRVVVRVQGEVDDTTAARQRLSHYSPRLSRPPSGLEVTLTVRDRSQGAAELFGGFVVGVAFDKPVTIVDSEPIDLQQR
jgi:hypothetical protein